MDASYAAAAAAAAVQRKPFIHLFRMEITSASTAPLPRTLSDGVRVGCVATAFHHSLPSSASPSCDAPTPPMATPACDARAHSSLAESARTAPATDSACARSSLDWRLAAAVPASPRGKWRRTVCQAGCDSSQICEEASAQNHKVSA
jgi:hypothetical protein